MGFCSFPGRCWCHARLDRRWCRKVPVARRAQPVGQLGGLDSVGSGIAHGVGLHGVGLLGVGWLGVGLLGVGLLGVGWLGIGWPGVGWLGVTCVEQWCPSATVRFKGGSVRNASG